jgi:hypothetical protein
MKNTIICHSVRCDHFYHYFTNLNWKLPAAHHVPRTGCGECDACLPSVPSRGGGGRQAAHSSYVTEGSSTLPKPRAAYSGIGRSSEGAFCAPCARHSFSPPVSATRFADSGSPPPRRPDPTLFMCPAVPSRGGAVLAGVGRVLWYVC